MDKKFTKISKEKYRLHKPNSNGCYDDWVIILQTRRRQLIIITMTTPHPPRLRILTFFPLPHAYRAQQRQHSSIR